MNNSGYQKNTRKKGTIGEDKAVAFLEDKGFRILKRNFHFGRLGEIDIVAEEGDILVFIEVKARTSDTFGDPLFSITPRKQANIRRAAEGYLYVNKITDRKCRLDVIVVDMTGGRNEITHLKGAF